MRPEAGQDLIQRARHDPAAFGELYDMYLNRVYAFCLSRTGAQSEAEDLTAQTFERALGAIARYQARGAPFSPWLFRIASNLITDRGRQSGKTVNLGDQPLPEQIAEHEDDNPAAWVERWERATWLRDHIHSLPPAQQTVLRLRYWEGESTLEVAQRLGRSEGAIKQLVHRAVTALRVRLGEEAIAHG